MVEDALLVQSVQRFARSSMRAQEISDLLYQLAGEITDLLSVTGVGVSLRIDDAVRFVTSPSEAIIKIEQIQELRQLGPCVEAVRTGDAVSVTDLGGRAGDWPEYVEVAASVGIASVLGVPMRADGETIGAINIYHDHPRTWEAADIDAVTVLADIASGQVLKTSELEQSRRLSEQLQTALDNRIVIEQAKGIVAGTRNLSVDAAFELIRRQARNRSVPLRAVAEAIVNLGLLPED